MLELKISFTSLLQAQTILYRQIYQSKHSGQQRFLEDIAPTAKFQSLDQENTPIPISAIKFFARGFAVPGL
jgi:hypothetical protein